VDVGVFIDHVSDNSNEQHMTEMWEKTDPISKEWWNLQSHISRTQLNWDVSYYHEYNFGVFLGKIRTIYGHADYKLTVLDRLLDLKIEYLMSDDRDEDSIFERSVSELYDILIKKYLPTPSGGLNLKE